MNKFKAGDFVIPQKFEADGRVAFIPPMEPLTGKVHQIDSVDIGGLYYHIGNFEWPESALTPCYGPAGYDDEEELFDSLAHHVKKQMEKPLPTVVVEPERKTLGDFMLAAMTGLASNSGYSDNNWPDDWDDYVNRLAKGSQEVAKAAFELYEKEGRP